MRYSCRVGWSTLDAHRMIESSGRRKLNLCEFVPAPRILLVKHRSFYSPRAVARWARLLTLQICSTASVPQRCLHFVSCMGGMWASILRVAPVPYLRDPAAFSGTNPQGNLASHSG